VESASLTTVPPLGTARFLAVTPASGDGSLPSIATLGVSPEYFATLGTPIVEGRAFTADDVRAGRAVMVIDEASAQVLWPGENALGKCGRSSPREPCVEVVGVSRSRRYQALTIVSREIFQPLPQDHHTPQALLVRTRVAPRDAAAAVSAAMHSASPRLPFVSVRPLEDLADAHTRSFRLGGALFGFYGTAAVVLALVGLYALLAFSARRRTAEIGVRRALGATSSDVFRLVLRHGLALVTAGWIVGTGAALLLAQSAESLLFGVEPTDGAALAVGSLVVTSACLSGCVVPAWRAARVDPAVALRHE
jgi:hypothetical protein